MRWLARRFKYTQTLEEEIRTLESDRIKLLNHVSKEDAQHFLNRTGWNLPTEFGWDPNGYKLYDKRKFRR